MIFSKSKLLTYVGIAVGILAVKLFPLQPFAQSSKIEISNTQVEEMLLGNEHGAVYATVKLNFPAEFEAHVQDLTVLLNSEHTSGEELKTTAFEMGRDFTGQLMSDNATYLLTSHMPKLREIQAGTLELLEAISHDKELCLKVLQFGSGAFDRANLNGEVTDILMRNSITALEAVSMGRKFPVEHEAPTGQDYAKLFEGWSEQPDVTDELYNAMISDASQEEIYCDATISLLRYLVADQSPGADRIIVDLTASIYLPE